jgi:glycosyltransferase involved in cell wall biosynthesis
MGGKMTLSVGIVTPTTGSVELEKCIQSVQSQTYTNLKHYLFLDGSDVKVNLPYSLKYPIKKISLEENVGADGWYGHRVYAACSFLVDTDIIIYLDQDNWIKSKHVESLVNLIEQKNLDWAYCLRKIYDKEGKYICRDDCESLGMWPAWVGSDVHHVDTSCYAVKREVAVQVGHMWYAKWGADRRFFSVLMSAFKNNDCTREYTLCYRLGGNEGSAQKQFFMDGNLWMLKKYNGDLPWTL